MTSPPLVAVLGGTFDPVHLGHLHVAEWVRRVFEPERTLLLPAATPPHKPGRRFACAEDRLAMLRLAVGDLPWLEVSTLELDRGGISYTVETLGGLREGPPPALPLFVVGADGLAEIDSWREHETLLARFDLVAVARPGRERPIPREAARRIVEVSPRPAAGRGAASPPPGHGGRIFRVEIPPCEISSTAVRDRVRDGRPLDRLVPDAVADYIRRRGLYMEEATS